MLHHRVVDQHDAHALAVVQPQRFGTGEGDAVEGPGELLHVPGQVQLHLAAGVAAVGIVEQASQVGVGQYAAAVVAQADARVVQARAAGRRLHVHQRIAVLAGRMHDRADAGRAAVAGMGVGIGAGVAVHGRAATAFAGVLHRRTAAAFTRVLHRRAATAFGTRLHHRPAAALAAVVHHRPAAMPGVVAVGHVLHGQQRARVAGRHRRGQAVAHGQGAAGKAGAAHVLGEDRVGVLAGGLDDHVEGLGRGDAQFLHRHRVHVLAVGGDHGHLQAGDAQVEMGHRTGVDQTQQQLLAGAEQAGPVAGRRQAVEQVGVGMSVDVGDVAGRHPHPPPHAAVGQGVAQAVLACIPQEVADGALVMVVPGRRLLQPAVQRRRLQVGPVREQQHVFAVVVERRRLQRVDDDRPVQTGLFLEHRMAVVPVTARLPQCEAVQPRLARGDAVEAHPGHAVHVGRQQDAVPVDRGRRVGQLVAHPQGHGVAFAPAQDRCRQAAVDGDGWARPTGDVHRTGTDGQVEVAAGQQLWRARVGRVCRQPQQAAATGQAGEGQALDEAATRQGGRGRHER